MGTDPEAWGQLVADLCGANSDAQIRDVLRRVRTHADAVAVEVSSPHGELRVGPPHGTPLHVDADGARLTLHDAAQAPASQWLSWLTRGFAQALTRVLSQPVLNALTEHTTDWLAHFDAEFRLTYVNRAWCEALGTTLEASRGRTIDESGLPDGVGGRWRVELNAAREYKRRRRLEFTCCGRRLQASFEPEVTHEQVTGVVVLVRDVTEERSSQELQAISELQLRALIEDLSDMIVRWRPSGERVFVNLAYCRERGTSRATLEGASRWDELTEEGATSLRRRVEALTPEQPVTRGELPVRHEGGARVEEWVDRGRFDGQGRLVELLSVGRDVTQQRAMELRVRQAERMESVGLVAGGVAHDLNNLLTPILGYSDLLAASIPSNDPRTEAVEQVRTAARAARGLTRRLLGFSQRDAIGLDPIELAPLVRAFGSFLRRTLREDVELEVKVEGNPKILGDKVQLEQAMLNLVLNAQDAQPRGGHIRVWVGERSLEGSPDAFTPALPALSPGAYVMLEVSDRGSGMTREVQHRAFEPFYTTKPPGEGSGLGLATVYGVARRHGASVSLHSHPGEGTTFSLWFPRADAPTLEHHPEPAPKPTTREGTVLVVEDDPLVRQLTCRVLTQRGFCVLEAAEPRVALDVARAHTSVIDLLLTDVVLPQFSGRELHLQLLDHRPGLRVLYMTGYAGKELGQRGVPPESAVLEKPFSVRTLVDAVVEALGLAPSEGST